MRTVLKIFKRDFRRAFSNRAAALIMVGVSLLPSLYAWFNIAANIDPYANTQGVKVAIANCDVGKETELLSMNAGENIVESLKKNDKLGWTFVSESQAKEGVKSGKYYAAIVIPKDFSESLLSILSGKLRIKIRYHITVTITSKTGHTAISTALDAQTYPKIIII